MSTRRAIGRAVKAKSIVSKAVVVEVDVGSSTQKGRKRGWQKNNATDIDTKSEGETSPYFNSETQSAPNAFLKPGTKLDRSFYDQDTVTLAKAMLGKTLCRRLPDTGEILKGTVVETEAYPGVGDAASYSFKGVPTPASMPMFMDPGTAFVYMTYGMYYCFNISAKDTGGACLLRAAEVHENYEIMQDLRTPKKRKLEEAKSNAAKKRLKPHELANGPSKLCQAFGINKDSCNKIDITISDDLWLETGTDEQYLKQQFEIELSKRVGIDRTPPEARNKLFRFYVKDNLSVSKAKFKT